MHGDQLKRCWDENLPYIMVQIVFPPPPTLSIPAAHCRLIYSSQILHMGGGGGWRRWGRRRGKVHASDD